MRKQPRLLQRQMSPRSSISAVVLMAAAGIVATVLTRAAATPVTNVTIDGSQAGPAFQGVGAISGGGGNSRLLIDYPEPQRSQILDDLFKPGYGAGIQILKLEIGGDENSTDGSEASIEHARGQINCGAGYEWWLAQQAKARNPNILFSGLQWAAPGWTGDGQQTIWTTDNVNYVISWMQCAQSHGLTISYLGGWNEKGYNAGWYEQLRSALNTAGFKSTKIMAADSVSGPWNVANDMSTDPAFNAAVDILGAHDTCPNLPTTGYSCSVSATAAGLGKPLWESELGRMDANAGGADWVRSINNGFIDAGISGFIQWPIIDSMPAGLPYENRGAVTADQPWSGNYNVNLMTWAYAHTTQFVPVGWHHVGNAAGQIGDSGTYVAYQAPDHSAWSLVAENTSSFAGQTVGPQTIDVTVTGGLPNAVVHAWQTNLWDHSNTNSWFQKLADITPSGGKFSFTIPAGYVVSFTTTTGQSKGMATPPAAAPLNIPVAGTLATDDGSDEPAMLAPINGAFGLAPCQGGLAGSCTQQEAPAQPVQWTSGGPPTHFPFALFGDVWTDYTVTAKLLFTQTSGSGGVIGRFSADGSSVGGFNGYVLHLAQNGNWQLLKNYSAGTTPTPLASGTVGALGTGTWHTLALKMNGSQLTASIDGAAVGQATDTDYTSGSAGIEAGAFTSTWPINQYRDLSVTAVKTADLNNDNQVNVFDLSVLLSAWGTDNPAVAANLNRDGTVGIFDLSILLSRWGQ